MSGTLIGGNSPFPQNEHERRAVINSASATAFCYMQAEKHFNSQNLDKRYAVVEESLGETMQNLIAGMWPLSQRELGMMKNASVRIAFIFNKLWENPIKNNIEQLEKTKRATFLVLDHILPNDRAAKEEVWQRIEEAINPLDQKNQIKIFYPEDNKVILN